MPAERVKTVHRVFRPGAVEALNSAGASEDLRAFLRSLGLIEQPSGDCYLYLWRQPGGVTRQFATLQAGLHSATVYLYPDALDRAPGHASAFYRTLDDAGLGMGSKLGPSIGINLGDARQLRLFRDGLAALLAVPAR
jgi:hypothetical protein